MRHLGPKVLRDRGKKERNWCQASIYTRTFMQTIRLHRAGLFRQLTVPTPGCTNRLIHRSAVGKQSLSFCFCWIPNESYSISQKEGWRS